MMVAPLKIRRGRIHMVLNEMQSMSIKFIVTLKAIRCGTLQGGFVIQPPNHRKAFLLGCL